MHASSCFPQNNLAVVYCIDGVFWNIICENEYMYYGEIVF